MRARYTRRLSGPLLDRFDLAVSMSRPSPEELFRGEPGEPTARVAERVAEARSLAVHRGVRSNADLPSSELNGVASLAPQAAQLLERKLREGEISARGLHRIHRVARTVADLDKSSSVSERHVAEAIHLRSARSVLLPG
jgi:magnesium chelatase family protein